MGTRRSSYEERIADLVVAKLEPRLRAMISGILRPNDPPPDTTTAAESDAYWQQRSDAQRKTIVETVKAPTPRTNPIVRLECGHTLMLQRRSDRLATSSQLIGQIRDCRPCDKRYEEAHPSPPSVPSRETKRRVDEALDRLRRNLRRR